MILIWYFFIFLRGQPDENMSLTILFYSPKVHLWRALYNRTKRAIDAGWDFGRTFRLKVWLREVQFEFALTLMQMSSHLQETDPGRNIDSLKKVRPDRRLLFSGRPEPAAGFKGGPKKNRGSLSRAPAGFIALGSPKKEGTSNQRPRRTNWARRLTDQEASSLPLDRGRSLP
jgi:hypothetical protein